MWRVWRERDKGKEGGKGKEREAGRKRQGIGGGKGATGTRRISVGVWRAA